MLATRQSRMIFRASQSGIRNNVTRLSSLHIIRPNITPTHHAPIIPSSNLFMRGRYYATTIDANTSQQQKNTRTANDQPAPDMDSSLDSIVPESIFTATTADSSSLTRESGRKVVSIILQQLRDGLDSQTREEVIKMEEISTENVKSVLKESGSTNASGLHHFTVQLLKQSRDPRRLPIASRLFLIAFDRDPLTMQDPTVETIQQGSPLFTSNQWGINASGYSWASMVLSNQALPPTGLHLLKRGSEEQKNAVKDQQAAAIRVYATLATVGDPQGMLGMGRILLASAQKTDNELIGKQDESEKKRLEEQSTKLRDRAIVLWTKAGEKGLSEAWYELGLISLNEVQPQPTEGSDAQRSAKAEMYFEKGAKMDDVRCSHALGILLTQKAMQLDGPERKPFLDQSLEHFRKAAELGDGQSAHQVGMRYLLRQEMIDEIGLGSDSDQGPIEGDGRSLEEVRKQASEKHFNVWGIEPDDSKARQWFTKGSDVGFMPAMMNLAGMLFEARGGIQTVSNEERIKELKKSESLYAKVAAQAGVMAQQQQQQAAKMGATGGNQDDPSANLTAEMTNLAKHGLEKVQNELKSLADEMEK